MIGWLWPKSPLSPREKAWVETRMHWLANHWGIERLLNATVALPTDDDFPGASSAAQEDAQHLLTQVCRFLGTDGNLQIELPDRSCGDGERHQGQGPGHHCHCGPGATDDRTEMLVATIAHQVSLHMLERGDLTEKPPGDARPLAELLTVFLGMGVSAVNTATERRVLPARVVSYALALFAWMRDETRPGWARHLGLDAEAGFRTSLRYLRRTGDSLFQSATVRRRYGALSVQEVSRQLETGTPSVKVAALWELAELGPAAAEAIPLVADCLHARHPDIRGEAAMTLASVGNQEAEIVEQLGEALRDNEESVRAAAATALGLLRPGAASAVPDLAQALRDTSPLVVRHVAHALCQFETEAREATAELFHALRTALVGCNDPAARHLATAIRAIVPHPESILDDYFDEHDQDLHAVAREVLRESAAE